MPSPAPKPPTALLAGWINALVVPTGFELHARGKANRHLNILTVLSPIFNPITLLTGIRGMNFVHMPEL